jgi:hypothetical protein
LIEAEPDRAGISTISMLALPFVLTFACAFFPHHLSIKLQDAQKHSRFLRVTGIDHQIMNGFSRERQLLVEQDQGHVTEVGLPLVERREGGTLRAAKPRPARIGKCLGLQVNAVADVSQCPEDPFEDRLSNNRTFDFPVRAFALGYLMDDIVEFFEKPMVKLVRRVVLVLFQAIDQTANNLVGNSGGYGFISGP